MNKIVIVLLIALTGCSAHVPTQLEVEAHNKTEDARKACYEAQKLDLTGVPEEAKGYVALTSQFIKANGDDPCSSDNLFTYLSTEVEQKNKSIRSGVDGLTDLGVFYIGGEVAKKLIGGMGDTNKVEGQFNELNVSKDKESGNTANRDSYNPVSLTDSPQDSNVSTFDQVNN